LYIFTEINLAKFAEIGDKQAQNCSFVENEIIESANDVCSTNQAENLAIYKSYLLYACLVAGNFIFGIFVSIAFYQLVIIATRNVHDIALAGLLKSPMRFFNINPPGRLLNRFAQDLGKIDEHFPVCSEETLTVLLQLIGLFCVAMWANWFRSGEHCPFCRSMGRSGPVIPEKCNNHYSDGDSTGVFASILLANFPRNKTT